MDWEKIKRKIERDFPGVDSISTSELAAWLNDADRQTPVLIDARAANEYDVSHLRGAQLATDVDSALEILNEMSAATPIVVYCSVGYRSAKMVKRLQETGFTQAVNLMGSIFQWANEGRPVFQDSVPVEQVHPFNRKWGRLLQKSFHRY